jgi:hypothetical protein
VNKGLRRLVPSRSGITMPDTIPGCRTAFRSNAKIVRHYPGTASVIPPEYCPPSVRNAVRHGPERATPILPRMPLVIQLPPEMTTEPVIRFPLICPVFKETLAENPVGQWSRR